MLNKNLKTIPMPARYGINTLLIFALWGSFILLISTGAITDYWQGIVVTIGINIILTVSLNISTGYLGQLPLGHAGFMAVGAYAGSIFLKATPVGELLKSGADAAALPYIIGALVISGLVAGFFGLIIGIPALRLRGDYLAIITLGFGEIIRIVLNNIDDLLGVDFTYGAAGLKRIPKFSDFTIVFFCVVATCLIVHLVMKSKSGRAILSIRENEIAAESCGINTTYYKTLAFVMSAFFAGIAGCLYAGYLGSLFPSSFDFMRSIEILVMVVLGGMGSMFGSVLSATTLTVVSELLRDLGELRMVIYGLLLVVLMVFLPRGLMGTYDFSMSRILEKIMNKINPKKAKAAASETKEGNDNE